MSIICGTFEPWMEKKPLITLGIPAYGRSTYLREALLSCLAQDYPQVEILVADDASPRDPWPEIADLASDRWSYVRHEKNLGGPGNFNFLIQKSRGDLFILHQDDDLLHPQFCTRAAEAFAQKPEAVFYSGSMVRGPRPQGIMGFDQKPVSGPWLPLNCLAPLTQCVESLDAQLMLLFHTPFMHPALAMKRSVLEKIGGYFNEFMFASDNITLGQMLFHGPALYDPRLSGFFRLHQNASTSTPLREQYACRRKVAQLLLPRLMAENPLWSDCLLGLLKNLPRSERWKLLVQAMEARLPEPLLQTLAEALGGRSDINFWRARLLKARWFYQGQSWLTADRQGPKIA